MITHLKRAALAACAMFCASMFAAPALASDCKPISTPQVASAATVEVLQKTCAAFADVAARTVTPTVTASSAYAANAVVGGRLSFTTATRQEAGDGLIQSVTLHFKTAQTAASDFFWCNASQLTSTTLTDKAAVSVNAADFSACRAIHITDCTSMGTPTVCSAENLALPYGLASGTTGYGFLVTRGTPTFGSTSDVAVTVRFLRNN